MAEEFKIPYEDIDLITGWGVATANYFEILSDCLRPDENLRKRWTQTVVVDEDYYKELKQRYTEKKARNVEEDKNYKYDGSLNYLKIYTKELDGIWYLSGQDYDNCKVGDIIIYTHIEEDWKGHVFKECEAVVLETHCTPPYLQ